MDIQPILDKITELWTVYEPLLPSFLFALVLAIILTPIAGRFASRIGAIDLPAHLRRRSEKGLERNVNAKIHPRLGGLAMATSILITMLLFGQVGTAQWGIVVGILIVVAYGLLDDVRDLPFSYQLIGQVLAAMAVVVSGISIHSIQVAGIFLDFSGFQQEIALGNLVYTLVLPADIITIVWIVAMINFVNWMSGMDGLNHLVTAVASAMILLIAVDSGNLFVAALVTAHLGANLGSAVFNYPPSFIFPGAIGEHLNGFLLAVFAILSGSKLPLALIALALPIIDALWVMLNRIRLYRKEAKGVRDLLMAVTKPDTNHLHHRLMALGFSWKAILGIEVGITIALSAFGFWLSGFRDEFVAIVGSLAAIILVISGIYSYSRAKESRRQFQKTIQPEQQTEEATIEVVYKSNKDEEKFIY